MQRLTKALLIFCATLAYGGTQVYFSPDDNITSHLLEEIGKAKIQIHVAIYMLTDKRIASALIDAKKRGVDVQVVADRISAESSYGKCEMLAEAKIQVFVDADREQNLAFSE